MSCRLVFGRLSALLVLLPLACEPAPAKEFVKSAKFGVFFGGQIQERRDVPFELDSVKQTQGFRVEFSEPLTTDTAVEWRLDTPKAPTPSRKKSTRAAPASPETSRPLSGNDTVHAGQTRFDHTTSFRPGDPLGLWNVRVVVKGKVVIDRPVEVFDPVLRDRLALAADGGS